MRVSLVQLLRYARVLVAKVDARVESIRAAYLKTQIQARARDFRSWRKVPLKDTIRVPLKAPCKGSFKGYFKGSLTKIFLFKDLQ